MSRDYVLPMPSDLHVSPFEVESVAQIPKGLVSLTVDIPASRSEAPDGNRPPARWKTPEFIFYAVFACIVVPTMVWTPVMLSSSSHPNYIHFYARLSPGWLFGRRLDNSDAQYRSFRNNTPSLALLAGVHVVFKHIYTHFRMASPQNRLYLVPFLLTFSVIMLLGLHGASILKIFVILGLNYTIAKVCKGSKLGPILTWIFNVAVLFANERNSGYSFGKFHPSLELLDSLAGVYPRWHLSFNITMLRLVSFNMDYYWACNSLRPEAVPSGRSEKLRKSTPHAVEWYSFANYVTYVIYPPLYIAGPIITFNDFFWQMRKPTIIPGRLVMGYFFRFLISFLTMELVLHFMYVVAIKDSKAWVGDTPFELSMIGFWNLIIVWLKLLLPWRFFRLWALVDGIDPPENMVRCMANNYSTLGFWRSWHRSYNLWITRYIYIPLGGANRVLVNSVLVFSFVALWHDLSFRLLAWGWLVSLFIIPELAARYILPERKYGSLSWYRHVCALGAVVNILAMMCANLVGFVVGVEGTRYLLKQLTGSWEGVWFLMGASACLFVGTQLMFEYREEEMRKGIYRKC